jgi:hypothetical protein
MLGKWRSNFWATWPARNYSIQKDVRILGIFLFDEKSLLLREVWKSSNLISPIQI